MSYQYKSVFIMFSLFFILNSCEDFFYGEEDLCGIPGGNNKCLDECSIPNGDGVEQECGCGTPGEFGIPEGACD